MADNYRLRQLLDQHDAPNKLRHRLRSTVALLRMVIRKSAESRTDIDAYMGLLEDRLDAIVRVQSIADEQGIIELQKLLTDELLHYRPLDGVRVLLSGPELALQPRMGQLLALALHELTVNAVEHGSLGGSTGRVEINWRVDETGRTPTLTFLWKEYDEVAVGKSGADGFGTEVLTRLLAYELGATTQLDFESDGLRCTIQLPLG
ncbi:sensor histidine kinase [Rhodopseudomonas sp. HC1]|uniref:HWE histidine kinase domain-containing protein n=1 Tax=Rhodopseudomonas infernalis TaxID=2897386 RepID=UPI001EE874A6|nr:HWE histidine kinase domain-containing protein [Rhodopseudomonas infernalis]MCG6206401.1 sensor histidine kinase [Rhodopseudomonas infernalis]